MWYTKWDYHYSPFINGVTPLSGLNKKHLLTTYEAFKTPEVSGLTLPVH